MYKKGTGNDKQGKDAGNRKLCPYRSFSQAIMYGSGELKFMFATYRFAYLIILTATSQIYKGHGAFMIQIMGDLEPASLKIKRTGGVAN